MPKSCNQIIKVHERIKSYCLTTKKNQDYTESNRADCTLQLGLILKDMFFLKIFTTL